jgi:hypothetical protein
MKAFLIKISMLSFSVFASIIFVFLNADERTGPFYKRFTSPKQSALILGSSRAAQGIMPSVINEKLNNNSLYNFAFTYNTSPYGPVYLNSIKRKLNSSTKNSVFILTVDPWVVSNDSENPNDISQFGENKHFLASKYSFNKNPNFSYLIQDYDDMYVKILFNFSPYILHDDGWLEVKHKNEFTERQIEEKTISILKKYSDYAKLYKLSNTRITYLGETINFLKQYGKVFIVRLPIDERFLTIEKELMPNFDDEIVKLSNQTSVNYLNLSNVDLKVEYLDGHHLTSESAYVVSNHIGNWMNEILNNNK